MIPALKSNYNLVESWWQPTKVIVPKTIRLSLLLKEASLLLEEKRKAEKESEKKKWWHKKGKEEEKEAWVLPIHVINASLGWAIKTPGKLIFPLSLMLIFLGLKENRLSHATVNQPFSLRSIIESFFHFTYIENKTSSKLILYF